MLIIGIKWAYLCYMASDGKIPAGDIIPVFDAIIEQYNMTEILKDEAFHFNGMKDMLKVNCKQIKKLNQGLID